MFKKGKCPNAQVSDRSQNESQRDNFSSKGKRKSNRRFKVPKLDLSQDIDDKWENGLVDNVTVKAKIDYTTMSQATTLD